jgi:tRNA threonylcarbamoyladenosine biosynthesis protein TsaB
MLTLGVETSGHCAAVALLRDEQILAEVSLMEAGRLRSNRLVSAVREMLAAQGCAVEALDVLAVGHGPGSFTGLRVGVLLRC